MTRTHSTLPFIVIGGGGHASVVVSLLRNLEAPILGVTDPNDKLVGSLVLDVPVLGDDRVLDEFESDRIALANGLGIAPKVPKDGPPDPGTGPRRRLYQQLTARGLVFPGLKHPSATVAEQVEIFDGVQIMAGAVVQPRTVIGENAVINTAASVDHDCSVGPHAFVAPGAILCGTVCVGSGALVGAGAVILPGVTIGENAVIGAGACIRRNVEAGRFSF